MSSIVSVILSTLQIISFAKSNQIEHNNRGIGLQSLPYTKNSEKSYYNSVGRLLDDEENILDESSLLNDGYHRNVEIFGNSTLGYYYVSLYIGEKHEKFDLILDTGSPITTFPCSDCKECGKHDNPPKDVNTDSFEHMICRKEYFNWRCIICEKDQCTYEIKYGEGSEYKGTYSQDYVLFKDEISTFDKITDAKSKLNYKSLFGCTSQETKLLKSQDADGIIGIGRSTNNKIYPPSIIDISKQEHRLSLRGFSLCFNKNGGFMRIGNFNYDRHKYGNQIYTEKMLKYGHYYVSLSHIYADTHQANFPGIISDQYDVFFDSGTTIITMPPKLFDKVLESMTIFCNEKEENCGGYKGIVKPFECFVWDKNKYSTLADWFGSFPKLKFLFGTNSPYFFEPNHYFAPTDEENTPTGKKMNGKNDGTKFCMSIDPKESFILGGNFMAGHDVFFNLEKETVSWIPSNCDPDSHNVGNTTPQTSEKESQPTLNNTPVKDTYNDKEISNENTSEHNTHTSDNVATVYDKIYTKKEESSPSHALWYTLLICIIIVLLLKIYCDNRPKPADPLDVNKHPVVSEGDQAPGNDNM